MITRFLFQKLWLNGTIIVVEDMSKLGETIINYDELVSAMGNGLESNNEKFNRELGKIVDKMFK